MKLLRHLLYFLTLTILISACKTSKPLQKTVLKNQQAQNDTLPDIKEPILLTIKGDTLKTLDAVVAIGIHRLIKDTVSIIGVGDIMMGTNFPKAEYLPPNKGKDLLTEARPFLIDADVTFGNLEGVILDKGGTPKYCKNPDVCYAFRSPKYLLDNLTDAGFDVVSMANNHAGDFGNIGRKNTQRVLDSLGLFHAGLLNKPYETFIIDGMKYGFAAFAPNTGTMSINDLPRAKEVIQHLDSISDIVIVSFHGGAEGKKYQHVTRKRETFYGENRGNVYEFAHQLVDAGADIIFGHGPHVLRATEVYKKRFIIYSLGNFCTYARFNLSGANKLAPIVKVFTNSKGEFLYGKVFSFNQYRPGGPVLDENNAAAKKLKALTAKDFPESVINIDENGNIKYITH